METTIRLREITRNHDLARSAGFMKRLAHFIKALFDTAEQNPLELDDRMAARMYL